MLCIDPGLKTGMSCFEWEKGTEPVLVRSRELDMDEYVIPIRWEYENNPHIEIVCERFVITPATAKKSQAPYSLELIGALKQVMRDYGHDPEKEILFQSPSDVMKMFTNPKLKLLGYWHRGGAGHALDSIRHALFRLVNLGWVPRKILQS